MPTIPSYTKCQELGCKNTKSKFNRFCLEHGGKDLHEYKTRKQSDERKSQTAMYNTRQWEALRTIQLSQSPLCAGCMADGIVTPATVVDHIFPWTHIGKEAFYVNHYQSLCATHHAHKGQLERHGIYRRFGSPHIDHKQGDYDRIVNPRPPSKFS